MTRVPGSSGTMMNSAVSNVPRTPPPVWGQFRQPGLALMSMGRTQLVTSRRWNERGWVGPMNIGRGCDIIGGSGDGGFSVEAWRDESLGEAGEPSTEVNKGSTD